MRKNITSNILAGMGKINNAYRMLILFLFGVVLGQVVLALSSFYYLIPVIPFIIITDGVTLYLIGRYWEPKGKTNA